MEVAACVKGRNTWLGKVDGDANEGAEELVLVDGRVEKRGQHSASPQLVDAHLLLLLFSDLGSELVVQGRRFLHVLFDGFVEQLGDEGGLSGLLFSHEDDGLVFS